jgi:hypothetical protein
MQKNKKALVLALTAGCAAVMLVSLIATNGSGKLSFLAEGTGTSKTLSFTSSNQPSLKDGLYYAQSRYVSVVCGDATTYSGGFIHLKAGSGYVRNIDMINELESVTVTFATTGEGKLRLGYSYHDALENDNLDIWSRETGDGGATYLTSGVTVSSGLSTCRYIYLAAETEDVDISSIEVKYGSNNCAKPAYVALPSNLNKVFNASNRLNLELAANDWSSSERIRLEQGKPSTDTQIYNGWLKEQGVTSDISALSSESTEIAWTKNEMAGYWAHAYKRSVNFTITGQDVYGVNSTTSNTILPGFLAQAYVAKDWGASYVGDHNPFTGEEFDVTVSNSKGTATGTGTADSNKFFALQYDLNLTFKNVTFKTSDCYALSLLYGRTTGADYDATFSNAENQAAIDMGTDLGCVKNLTLENCTFIVDSTASTPLRGVDIEALTGTVQNTITNSSAVIRRFQGGTIKNCRFVKAHDASNQSSAIYGYGMNNLAVTGCQFGDAAYNGSTNTNEIDYNTLQISGYTLAGTNVYENNVSYDALSRHLRSNFAVIDSDSSWLIKGNEFHYAKAKNMKFSGAASEYANMKLNTPNIKLVDDNVFYDSTKLPSDVSAADVSTSVIASRDTTYLDGAYVNWSHSSDSHIAF